MYLIFTTLDFQDIAHDDAPIGHPGLPDRSAQPLAMRIAPRVCLVLCSSFAAMR